MLHHRDDIFYLVKATIVMHNMMVETQEVDDVIMTTSHEGSRDESISNCELTQSLIGSLTEFILMRPVKG